jgi:hypothetical protein
MRFLPTINFTGISCWTYLFVANTKYTLLLSEIVIAIILATAVMIFNIASAGKLDWVSFIGLRMGFSVYAGWLTSATILGICITLKSFGFTEADLGINETHWGIAILIVAALTYMTAGYLYRNPLYAGVFIWTLFAIRDETTDASM